MMAVTPELRDVATALLDKQKDEMDLSTMRMTTTRLLAANAALRRELEETQRHFADNTLDPQTFEGQRSCHTLTHVLPR